MEIRNQAKHDEAAQLTIAADVFLLQIGPHYHRSTKGGRLKVVRSKLLDKLVIKGPCFLVGGHHAVRIVLREVVGKVLSQRQVLRQLEVNQVRRDGACRLEYIFDKRKKFNALKIILKNKVHI